MSVKRVKRCGINRAKAQVGRQFSQVVWSYHPGRIAALALQFGFAGIGADTMRLSATLAPSTVIGVLVGRSLVSRITEQTFRYLLVIILASTAIILFSTLIGL